MYIFPLRKKLSREKGKEKRKKAFVLFHPKITRPFIPYLSASSSFKSPLTYTVFSLSLCLFLRLIRNENRRKKGGERKQRKGKVWFPFLPRLPRGRKKRWSCVYQADISKCRAVYQVFRGGGELSCACARRGHGNGREHACIESTTSLNLHNKASRGREYGVVTTAIASVRCCCVVY